MTQNELDKILENHKKWLNGEDGGIRAYLWNTDFRGAHLRDAYLRRADFLGADFRDAYLRGAHFRDAYLRHADFLGADFQGADFRGANIDYSCWPLWCGSLDVKVDRRIFCQLAYHLCRVIVDDYECKEAQLMLGRLANEFHRAAECGRVAENEDKR